MLVTPNSQRAARTGLQLSGNCGQIVHGPRKGVSNDVMSAVRPMIKICNRELAGWSCHRSGVSKRSVHAETLPQNQQSMHVYQVKTQVIWKLNLTSNRADLLQGPEEPWVVVRVVLVNVQDGLDVLVLLLVFTHLSRGKLAPGNRKIIISAAEGRHTSSSLSPPSFQDLESHVVDA